MTIAEWKESIIASMKDAGVYQVFFEGVVNTLAEIMARRDDAVEAFAAAGAEMVTEHTNKFGATNEEQSPLVRIIRDYDKLILLYMRELCLTPAAYKRLRIQQQKNSTLEEILSEMGDIGIE